MAQKAQIVDITKSYLPCDPNYFVQNLINTDREDGEEKSLPVVPYSGYNFLPTSYGYRSYFGLTSQVDIASLASRVQFIIAYQLPNYQTRLIALAEDGIWWANPSVSAAVWTQAVTLTFDPAILKEWTYCIIENILYMYSQGGALVYKTNITVGVELEILSFAPSFLNMEGQMGIFKAGLRLGFFDSANSIGWSSNVDLTDFTPSLENLAGNTIFGDLVGRIVTVKSHGDGFVIYATKSVIAVGFSSISNILWESRKVLDNTGIIHSRAVCFGQDDNEHFFYSTNGIYRLGSFTAITSKFELQPILAELYDYIRESRDPIYLEIINSRFLFFHIVNPAYIYSDLSFIYEEVSPYQLMIGGNPWDLTPLPVEYISGNVAAQAIKQFMMLVGGITKFFNVYLVIPQDDVDSPLNVVAHTGPFPRAAASLGFTIQDLIDSYIEDATVPDELIPTSFSFSETITPEVGMRPAFPVSVVAASTTDVIELLHKQTQDWFLQTKHQLNAAELIDGVSKTLAVVPSTTIEGYTTNLSPTLPEVPAPLVEDTVVGDYITGEGNIELQKFSHETRIRFGLRKYYQRKFTVTRRKTTDYTWRSVSAENVSGYEFRDDFENLSNTNPGTWTPSVIDLTNLYANTDSSAGYQTRLTDLINQQILDQAPATVSPGEPTTYSKSSASANLNNGGDYTITYVNNANPDSTTNYTSVHGSSIQGVTRTPYYKDSQVTYTYIVSYALEDMGNVTVEAVESMVANLQLVPGSSPPEYTLSDEVSISFAPEEVITFTGVPAWDGFDIFKFLNSLAYLPFRMDGSFGDIANYTTAVPGYNPATDMPVDSGSYVVYGDSFLIEYPGANVLMQTGAPAILYPTFAGSYVFDLQLKKFGKHKNYFTVLSSMDAVNQTTPKILSTKDFGMTAFLKVPTNEIRMFDAYPTDSILTYGKLGFYRLGMTNLLEVKALMRSIGAGSLKIDSSLDGRYLDFSRIYEITFGTSLIIEALPDISAKWFNVSFKGIYDIAGLEIRGVIAGRR